MAVIEVGKDVKELKEGDRVSVWVFIGCGECKYCKMGFYQLCSKVQFLGFTRDGGFANLLKVPARSCMKLPPEISFINGAFMEPLGTLYNAAKSVGVSQGKRVAITGVGPMGIAGLQICRALGASVICIDPSEERLASAKSIGANEIINPVEEDVIERINNLTEGEGVEISIECSGNPNGVNTALNVVGKLGKAAVVGECGEATIKPSAQLIRKRLTLYGIWNFNKNEWSELAKLIVKEGIDMERVVNLKLPLKDAAEGFKRFEKDKAVVVFYP